ncbi:hypothetical protein PM082_017290 [Marasmius tenuissimus]|nr:hypothetical protein PM082_017290 [Marasmius tenuissimus]
MSDKPEAESSMPKDETTFSQSRRTTSSSEYDLTQQILSLTDKLQDRVGETRECLERMNREEEEKRVRKSEREERMKSLLGGMANMQKSKSPSENVTPGPAEGGEHEESIREMEKTS